VPGRKTLMLHC